MLQEMVTFTQELFDDSDSADDQDEMAELSFWFNRFIAKLERVTDEIQPIDAKVPKLRRACTIEIGRAVGGRGRRHRRFCPSPDRRHRDPRRPGTPASRRAIAGGV